jgi:hypothetical protein
MRHLLRYVCFTLVFVGIPIPAKGQQPAPNSDSLERYLRGFGPEVRRGYAEVREATARFVSLDSAVSAGYPRAVAQCLHHAEHGGMGFHHVNPGYMDRTLEVSRPEILLYERQGSDMYMLTGVEYIVPYRAWPRDSVPPVIMGLDLKRSDQLSLWYLHMWVWKENPAGLFADWNPTVKCPS